MSSIPLVSKSLRQYGLGAPDFDTSTSLDQKGLAHVERSPPKGEYKGVVWGYDGTSADVRPLARETTLGIHGHGQ